MRCGPALLLAAGLWVGGSAASATAPVSDRYEGACDASAAVGLGQGLFVVADDEDDVLRLYQRGRPQVLATFDLTDHLGGRRASGKLDEADIEGAARIGSRIYWIGSHARNGKGKAAPARQRLFATDITGRPDAPVLKPVGRAWSGLLDAMRGDTRLAELTEAAQQAPESDAGLNIEGLAATPDGGLLIGLRNPRPAGLALVLPLRNPREVIEQGAAPQFGALLRLDLDGRGIRSLERVGDTYLIVAGPHGEADKHSPQPPFALYRWGGPAALTPPVLLQGFEPASKKIDKGDKKDRKNGAGLRPEALYADPDTGELHLLSDDGDAPVGQHACKDREVEPERKSFRGRALPR